MSSGRRCLHRHHCTQTNRTLADDLNGLYILYILQMYIIWAQLYPFKFCKLTWQNFDYKISKKKQTENEWKFLETTSCTRTRRHARRVQRTTASLFSTFNLQPLTWLLYEYALTNIADTKGRRDSRDEKSVSIVPHHFFCSLLPYWPLRNLSSCHSGG